MPGDQGIGFVCRQRTNHCSISPFHVGLYQ
jgi:hypothetical protein